MSDEGQAGRTEPDQAPAELWRDPSGTLRLERLPRDEGEGEALRLSLADAALDLTALDARALARALDAGARAAIPDEGYYQVYYVHEYRDAQGELVPCPALDEDPEVITEERPGRYTWDAADADGVMARVAWIGEVVAALDHARAEADLSRDEENARAWVSIYRMPDDERIWKGHWDALDEDVL